MLYPGTAEEIVRLGRYGVALSRASGMWVGMKITADVADGVYAFDGVGDLPITVPELEWEGAPWRYRQYPMLVPPGSLEAEAQMYGPRWAMVRAFLAANPINTVEVDAPGAWLGIVAGGKAFTDVRQALRDLGLDDDALARAGVKLLRLGMIHPIERDKLREFATRRRHGARRRGEVGVRRVRRPRRALRPPRRARRHRVRRTLRAHRSCPWPGSSPRAR